MQPIENILSLEPQGVLSLTGGGGKTSFMFHLARRLARSGRKVLTTTTTKIYFPTADQSDAVLVNADPRLILDEAAAALRATSHVTAAAGHMVDSGKLIGFAPELIKLFAESGQFDWILVEADGSARRPLKASAGHEPVIPSVTTVLMAVAGLEVLGEPLSEELVFRSELAGTLMGLAAGDIVTESAMARLLAHTQGPFKGAPTAARRYIFLNKADNDERREGGRRIASQLRLMARPVAEALIVGQALGRIHVHAVHGLAVSV